MTTKFVKFCINNENVIKISEKYDMTRKYFELLNVNNTFSSTLEENVLLLNDFLCSDETKKMLINGQVQSGKTNFILSSITMAIDLGIRYIIFLAGSTNILKNQSFVRMKKYIEETKKVNLTNNLEKFINTDLSIFKDKDEFLIVTALKEDDNLYKIKTGLSSSTFFHEKILIIDDEADYASLNLNKNEISKRSKINEVIVDIVKNKNFYVKYMAVTATPFANLKQKNDELLYPDSVLNLVPPNEYTGSNFFIENSELCYNVADDHDGFDDDLIFKTLLNFFSKIVIMRMLNLPIKNAQILYNFSNLTNDHEEIKTKIKINFDHIKDMFLSSTCSISDLNFDIFLKNKLKINKAKQKINFAKFFEEFKKFILTVNIDNSIIVLNGKNFDQIDANGGYKIIVGGILLSRGVTFPNLLDEIMLNTPSGRIALDTLLQRARWFGYRKNYEWIDIFLDKKTSNSFVKANELISLINNYFDEINSRKTDDVACISEMIKKFDDNNIIDVISTNKEK